MSRYNKTLSKAAVWASKEFNREISLESLRSKTKSPYYTKPRFFVMAYMRATRRFSLPQIALALQVKDHSTILYGLRRAHGYDGKLVERFTPLWNKEQFENMVAEDNTCQRLPPQAYERVNAEQILSIGLANLARYLKQDALDVAA
ncbi:MAG: helix-turn-helix domain-containing protein [Pseudomonadota bacterium]